jgi:gliding motility-associated-like protein
VKRALIILSAIIYSLTDYSQIDVTINTHIVPLSAEHGDTVSVCRDSLIIFEAEATLAGVPLEGALYTWHFDDGNTQEEIGLDSLSHNYSEGGGYRVRCEVSDQVGNTGYDIQTVRVAHQPVFEGTNNGLPQDQYGICKGSVSTLTGIAYPYEWEDDPEYFIDNPVPILLSESNPYTTAFSFYEFSKDAVFTAGDIDSVCISAEHSNMSDLRVELICPDGKSLILKDYASSNAEMGIPPDDRTDGYGEPYKYCWSPGSTNGLMSDFTGARLPESDYQSFEDFNVLNGCPMNGEWVIQISDNTPQDSGYVFDQEIVFSEEARPALWTFSDFLVNTTAVWEGSGNPVTQIQNLDGGGIKGIAVASPEVYGNNPYRFRMKNNWNCPADTSIGLPVERATFTADPPEGQAKLDVSLNSTTDWAVYHTWEPGDDSGILDGAQATYTYLEKGDYDLIYTAESEDGCTDSDTLLIEVSVEPSDLNVPNFFSPDDNGINDVLTLTVEGMEKFNFVIYSRWGRKMYETDNWEEAEAGWDGTMPVTNLKVSPGIYYFIFKGVGKDKKEWEEKGSIQILR